MDLDYVKKRDGKKVEFKSEKIENAVAKAAAAVEQADAQIAAEITAEVLSYLKIFFKNGGTVEVEQIQDLVEKVLIEKGYAEIAKAYILYREQHSKLRDSKKLFADAVNIMDDYLDRSDWKVNENSNMSYSLQGLNNYIASEVTGQYWLQEIYPKETAELHSSGDLHIHDLGNLSVYCCGWDLEELLRTGFRGVSTKIESAPPKHLKTALGQIVNFFYTLQGESSGAQAFSNFDTYLAPFIAYDGLNYEEVKQAMQEFLFNMNVPTRVGFQTPFTNITMDLEVPSYLEDQAVIIGGQYQEKCYGEFQEEMDMLNRAFAELMMEGDAKGRMFSFPIPTYNITEDFEWENEKLDPVWEMTAKFGIPYFSNFIHSDMDPEDARSMCLHPEENIFLKKNEEIKKMTIGKLFEEYQGERLDKNWFFASSNIETLSLNPKTGELEWAKINKFLKTKGEQLVTITAKDGKTMKVSPEHQVAVYTKKGIEKKKAKELNESDFLIVMQDASSALRSEGDFSEELLWFMGLFVADGNYLYDSRYEEEVLRGIQISFNRQEKSLIEKTKRFIKDYLDYDMKFILDPRYDNSLRGYIYNSEFANIFKHDYKVRKYNGLPDWIWSSSAANISSFIEGFFDGDGYENGKEIHINDKIEFLRNADFAVTEIKDIKINDLNYEQTFYDIELEKNHYFVHSDGNITHNCCRLRLDNKELRKRGGGLFGANPLTGSLGVITLNMPRIGYQAQNKEEFMERVYYLMDQAKESLEVKRRVLETLTEQGLYPYAKFYLRDIKKRFDQYWKNHFNTIGINGMNEALLNFMDKDISTPAGQKFSKEIMEKMRERLQQYQKETDNLYNLEATPAESTAYRFARLDREKFGDQITAANQKRVVKEDADPYYTNSTQLPVGLTDDIFTALELQDELQSLYTGGTTFHGFLGEKIDSIKATKKLVKRIAENFKLPYYTLTPSFSICPVHGYLPGEHEYCPKCEAEAAAEEKNREELKKEGEVN